MGLIHSSKFKKQFKIWLFNFPILADLFYRLLYEFRGLRQRTQNSASQDGEDSILAANLKNIASKDRIYLEIGSNDPKVNNNTYLLYLNGWHGVCVEPIRFLAEKHRRIRSKDEVVNSGIGSDNRTAVFYETIPHVYSSFDPKNVEKFKTENLCIVKEKRELPLLKISSLLADHPILSYCSLLALDCEGMDLEILRSNDWGQFSPKFLLVEKDSEEEIESFLSDKGYLRIAEFQTNLLFEREMDE